MGVAPIAPHTEVEFLESQPQPLARFIPPVPAKRHEGLFADAIIPRGPSFNPEEVRSKLYSFPFLSITYHPV